MNEQWTAAFLPDEAVRRLRRAADRPETADTPYTIVEELGRGGMGTVYRAIDATLDREVALKVSTLGQADPEEAERMRREARVMARLEHPGIVPVHDAGELPDGRVYYAMRLIRGERLDRWAEGRTLSDRLGVFRDPVLLPVTRDERILDPQPHARRLLVVSEDDPAVVQQPTK